MNWFMDMFYIWLFGAIPVILSLVIGTYYLKNDRFPWEKKASQVTVDKFESDKRISN